MAPISAPAFADLSGRQQLVRLREAAVLALDKFGLGGSRLRLVVNDFNATYRIETTIGDRFAMRLNTNSQSGVAAVQAEAAWVERLAEDERLWVPEPLRALDGRVAIDVPLRDHPRPVPVVVYRWIDAPDLGERVGRRSAAAIGRAAAVMHYVGRHARREIRTGRTVFDSVLMDSPDRLSDLEAVWFDDALRSTIGDAVARIEGVTADVLATPTHVLHGDLHPWNVKWRGGRLAVFDFDDCGFGAPLFELAIAGYYLRGRDLDDALLEGYREVDPEYVHDPIAFEALMASRSLLLLNDLVGTSTASHAEIVPEFAARTGRRLRHWLDTGRYRPDA